MPVLRSVAYGGNLEVEGFFATVKWLYGGR